MTDGNRYISYISGVTILGTPAEIYSYGTQYWLIVIAIIGMGYTVSTVYLPVFTTLKVGSSYEVNKRSLFKRNRRQNEQKNEWKN